jgi:small subunit ribosomal protein S11
MGKNKLITKTESDTTEAATPATDSVENTPVGKVEKKVSAKKQVLNGVAHINVSYNNTVIAIGDNKGQIIAWSSSGLLGFRGSKKSTPYAANMVAKDVVEKSKKFNLTNIKIIVKGIGPGRESAIRGLAGTGLNILAIQDNTPVAHNGVRRPKPRRV